MYESISYLTYSHIYPYAPVNWIPGRGGPGNGRAMPGLSCLLHQNAAPQGGDITN